MERKQAVDDVDGGHKAKEIERLEREMREADEETATLRRAIENVKKRKRGIKKELHRMHYGGGEKPPRFSRDRYGLDPVKEADDTRWLGDSWIERETDAFFDILHLAIRNDDSHKHGQNESAVYKWQDGEWRSAHDLGITSLVILPDRREDACPWKKRCTVVYYDTGFRFCGPDGDLETLHKPLVRRDGCCCLHRYRLTKKT